MSLKMEYLTLKVEKGPKVEAVLAVQRGHAVAGEAEVDDSVGKRGSQRKWSGGT
jgi:hypothetical protein